MNRNFIHSAQLPRVGNDFSYALVSLFPRPRISVARSNGWKLDERGRRAFWANKKGGRGMEEEEEARCLTGKTAEREKPLLLSHYTRLIRRVRATGMAHAITREKARVVFSVPGTVKPYWKAFRRSFNELHTRNNTTEFRIKYIIVVCCWTAIYNCNKCNDIQLLHLLDLSHYSY